jgi:hypothetical protein
VGPYPGFRVSFRFRLVGMRGALLVITRGNLAITGIGLFGWTPSCHWRSGLCVVLIFMAGQCLT